MGYRVHFLAVSLGFWAGLAMSSAYANDLDAMPAEMPPASYTAENYVDSRGCMFIRAGTDGVTRWVPRVNRNLELVCGFAPSRQSAVPVPASAAPAPAMARPAPVPAILAGYKPAWQDDRLNPARGPRSATGDAAMAAIWTDSVPMQRK